MERTRTSRYSSWWSIFAALAALAALVALLRIPSEGQISAFRLAAAAGLALVAALASFSAARPPLGLEVFLRSTPALSGSLAVMVVASSALFFLRYLDPPRLMPVFVRLAPILWYALAMGLQTLLASRALNGALAPREVWPHLLPRPAGIAFFSLVLTLIFVASTGLGVTRDPAYWGEPGVPILGWHTAAAILAGFLILARGSARADGLRRLLLPAAIWAFATGQWLSVPVSVLQNSFYSPITPPAYVPFPYSDAGFYDYLSQSLLIGTDYLGGIPPRPLYVIFLAALHGLLGQDYAAIIAAQTAILALLPVALYLLGRHLHSPAAGVVVALLATFRELVSLWISSATRVANSKILTTDLPTLLGIAVVCWLTARWFRHRTLISGLVAGGGFGLLLLLRTQSIIILPAVVLLALLAFSGRGSGRWLSSARYVLAAALTITPWLLHNYVLSGRLAFDDPKQMAVIYSQYSFSGNLDTSQFDPASGDLSGRLIQFTFHNPAYVATFVANHFFHTLVGSILALPRFEDFPGLNAPVNLNWLTWNGALRPGDVALIVVYLAVIAVGLGAAWHRRGWAGLLPLAFGLAYALSNGISRFSSWRYDLPADWIGYFYFGIGVIQILGGVLLGLGARLPLTTSDPLPGRQDRPRNPRGFLVVPAFVLLGALPWLAKGAWAPIFVATEPELVQELVAAGIDSRGVASFLSQADARVDEGRLLYPRHYRRGLGLSSANPWPAYATRDYPRLGFVLLNRSDLQAVFPSREALDFPHGERAIVLSCERDDHLQVRLIAFPGSHQQFESGALDEPCD